MPTGVYIHKKDRIKHKENLGKHTKKLWQNPEYRKHMSEAHKGYKMPNSQKEKIRNSNLGKKGNSWKGGIGKNNGYIIIYKPNHPFNCNRYVFRSHLVMEKMIGRFLKPKEVVHHKGIKYPIGSIENKQDDRPENLMLFPNNSEHLKFHHPKGSYWGCNKSFN